MFYNLAITILIIYLTSKSLFDLLLLKVIELEIKLSNEQEKSIFVKNVALGLVRNIEYRKSIFDSESSQVPVSDQYGNSRLEYVNNTKSYTEDSDAK